jgi:hypothetical protein
MYGLSDRYIATHGVKTSDRPGHQRSATLEYLLEQKVNFVVHPWVKGDYDEHTQRYSCAAISRYIPAASLAALPSIARTIEIPIRPGRSLRVLYLVPHPRIELAIMGKHWQVFPLSELSGRCS